MRDVIAPVSEMRKLKSGAKESQNGANPGLSASESPLFTHASSFTRGTESNTSEKKSRTRFYSS